MGKNKLPENVVSLSDFRKAKEMPAPVEPAPQKPSSGKTKSKPKRTQKAMASTLGVLALSLVFNYQIDHLNQSETMSMASVQSRGRFPSAVDGSRRTVRFERDAAWEKRLAESLARSKTRDIASSAIGRPATAEEKLRWGVLGNKYTILYENSADRIQSISLQNKEFSPSYLRDREEFLQRFGELFVGDVASTELSSVERTSEMTIELYKVYGKNGQLNREVRFELDRYDRLLSLKVQPI